MSSRSRPDRRTLRVAAYLLVMLILQGYAPAVAAVPLPLVAVLPGPEQTALVVDLGASAEPVTRRTATVTIGTTPQQAQLTPVVSDLLSVTFVIDTASGGGTATNTWLSAAARFILEAPTGTRAAVVADTSPPTLISPPQRGPMGIVRALSGVRTGGPRRTSEALTLAKNQLPASPAGHRVVVLYTGAPDAAGESATALGARFVQDGTLLIVVGTAGDSRYWSDAARATGGFFAPAARPAVVPALDQVATTLRSRYLVRFPTPATLPARVSVRIDTGKLILAGDAIVPAREGAPPPPGRPGFWAAPALTTIAGCLLLIGAAALLGRPRTTHTPTGATLPATHKNRSAQPFNHTAHPAQPSDRTAHPAQTTDHEVSSAQLIDHEDVNAIRPVARGRVAVPRAVRGRAAIRGPLP